MMLCQCPGFDPVPHWSLCRRMHGPGLIDISSTTLLNPSSTALPGTGSMTRLCPSQTHFLGNTDCPVLLELKWTCLKESRWCLKCSLIGFPLTTNVFFGFIWISWKKKVSVAGWCGLLRLSALEGSSVPALMFRVCGSRFSLSSTWAALRVQRKLRSYNWNAYVHRKKAKNNK